MSSPLELNLNSLTRDKLNIVLQRALQLQTAGEIEDGKNEYSQLMNLLRLLKQQQQQSPPLQQQQILPQRQPNIQPIIQPQQQSSLPTIQPQKPIATSSPLQEKSPLQQSSTDLHQQQQQLQIQWLQQHLLQQQQQQQQLASGSSSPTSTLANGSALNLQYQMLAYNLLSQNLASNNNNSTTSSIQQQIEPIVVEDEEQQVEIEPKIEIPLPPPEPPKTMAERLVESIYTEITDFKTRHAALIVNDAGLTPIDLLKGQQHRSHAHSSRQQRLLLPDVAPSGLDPYTILYERERRISQRAEEKKTELEESMLDGNQRLPLGYLLNEYYDDTVRSASPGQLKSIVKLKSLQLRDKQTRLREEIVKNMEEANRLATSVDRAAYRKIMKQTLREAKLTDKLERQQRIEREKKEKQRHLDYLQTVCNQGRDLIAWHKSQQAKIGKLGKAILQFHAHIEREEQRKADKRSKDRIRALRNDDEEAYLKLIDEAKDTRLTMLLRQTGAYLESLTKAVADQQQDNINIEKENKVEDEAEEEEEERDEIDEEMMLTDSQGRKVDYYKVAHRIQESVSQPTIMVGGKLKEYQVKGLQWMVSLYNNRLNGILADEMGLGKTIQTISLVTYLMERKKQNGPYLIIVPLSTLTNWALEFEKWAPSVTMICYKGPPDVRKDIQKRQIRHRDFQVLLTTFDYIIKDRPVLSKIKWQYMIIDEGHRMKNTQSKLTMVLRQYYSARYRLILTGTPLQNNLPELWSLLNFVLPKIFNSVKSFEEWFNTPFSNQGVQDKVELNEEEQLLIIKRLHKVLRPFLLRRLKKDVEAELPDKIETVIKCKLSALQSRLYHQMKRYGVMFGSNSTNGKTIKGLNNAIMQLRKICNHPFVFEEVEQVINPYKISNELLYRVSGKFDLLDRILPKLKATGHRVLIFFQMTQIMDIMEDFCIYRGHRHLRLDGSTKSDDRSTLLKEFNAPDSPYFLFLLSTRAGGLGLNLQTADTVIIFDSDWNPHQDLQAQDRAHRIGQTKEVRIFRLITENSVEENILARAQYKLDIDGKVIQAGKFDHRSTEEDREAFLRSLLEEKGNDDEEGAAEEEEEDSELDDEELNEILKRSDQEYAVFKKIDLERQRSDIEEWRRRYHDNPEALEKKPERLIQEWELPDIYRYDAMVDHHSNADTILGRGQRAKDTVRYDDGMTEKQWLRQFEEKNNKRHSSLDRSSSFKRQKY